MIELFIMVGVISWFATTAKAKGKNAVLWGIIGAISYYGPILLLGFVIFPLLVAGRLSLDNQSSYRVVGTILNLVVGIGCCFLARLILLSMKSSIPDLSNHPLHEIMVVDGSLPTKKKSAGKTIISAIIAVVAFASAVLIYFVVTKMLPQPGLAGGMNLISSDLGIDFGLSSEKDKEAFPNSRDANSRIFVNASRTIFVTSTVAKFATMITDSLPSLFAAIETNSAKSLQNVTFSYGDIVPIQLGDRAGYREYSLQNGQWKGATMIFIRSNTIVIIDEMSTSGNFLVDNIISHGQIISRLIESPRNSAHSQTATPPSFPLITFSDDAYSIGGIFFLKYLAPDGSFRVDLPATGCSTGQTGLSCNNTIDNLGWINIISKSNGGGIINDTNSQSVAMQLIEGLKPLGLLTSYSNLTFEGKTNGMYAYCYQFENAKKEVGNGCYGFETAGTKDFIIQFINLNLNKERIIWDTAYESFEVVK
jgi:hypothetical protein